MKFDFVSLHLTDESNKKESPSNDEKNCDSTATNDDHNIDRLKRAAVTALSAAAVKARLLAKQEEDHIRQLVSLVIEKQVLYEIMDMEIHTSSGRFNYWFFGFLMNYRQDNVRFDHEAIMFHFVTNC